MIVVTSHGAQVSADSNAAARLADEFATSCAVVVPRFLDASILGRIQDDIDRATLYERQHGSIASELCMPENTCLGLLHFLINDRRVFDVVQAITGVEHLTAFNGRVYRRLPAEHFDSWHTDLHVDRRLGMSINLSRAPYEGGRFEIRHEGTTHTLASIANIGPGDAMLFAIRDGLEHQVTRVEGTAPKTAFAGWFGSHHDYLETLRRDRTLSEVL